MECDANFEWPPHDPAHNPTHFLLDPITKDSNDPALCSYLVGAIKLDDFLTKSGKDIFIGGSVVKKGYATNRTAN